MQENKTESVIMRYARIPCLSFHGFTDFQIDIQGGAGGYLSDEYSFHARQGTPHSSTIESSSVLGHVSLDSSLRDVSESSLRDIESAEPYYKDDMGREVADDDVTVISQSGDEGGSTDEPDMTSQESAVIQHELDKVWRNSGKLNLLT